MVSEPLQRLNPCCDGRWSRTTCSRLVGLQKPGVLILVVMEDGLGRLSGRADVPIHWSEVLILVVMEDGPGRARQEV